MKKTLVLFAILLIGGYLRFYKLDWGQSFYFHPDENNIASLALSLINAPENLEFWTNGTFSYGSLLSYLTYFILTFFHKFNLFSEYHDFQLAIMILRFISAGFSTIMIFLGYKIAKQIGNQLTSLLTAAFIAFIPGLIQNAHYGTFESTLTFLQLAILYFCFKLINQPKLKYLLLSYILITISAAIKINSLILLPLPILAYLISSLSYLGRFSIFIFLKKLALSLLTALLFIPFALALSPYYLTEEFRGMLNYEKGVVSGSLDVFYTRSFIDTTPIFPFSQIYPYIINPLLGILFILFIFFLVVNLGQTIVSKQKSDHSQLKCLFIVLFFLVTFLPTSLLYSKWARYFIPTLPFIALGGAYILEKIVSVSRKQGVLLAILVTVVSLLQSVAFFSIYQSPDSRIIASQWIYNNLDNQHLILSETANVVDIPIYLSDFGNFKDYRVIKFNFYELENIPSLKEELVNYLVQANYIFIPSRRLFMNMGQHPELYPTVARYYQLLFSGELGFSQVAEFNSYPAIRLGNYTWEFPDEQAEETWTVFDHPVIRIYQKNQFISGDEYREMLGIL